MNIKQELKDILSQGIVSYKGGDKLFFSVDEIADQIDTLYRNKMLELVPERLDADNNNFALSRDNDRLMSYGFNACIDKFTDNIKGIKE